MSPNVPASPTKTPITLFLVRIALKNQKPKTMVSKGTVAFNIEAMALSISVSAKAKKYTGKKEPNNPEMVIHFHSFSLKADNLLNPTIIKNNAENKILNDPTCNGVNPTSPFLISIKELPQIMEREIK